MERGQGISGFFELVLIPKVTAPESITQLRPISLYSVSYKIISKVIVNRLKPIMLTLIVDNQTSFVGGRNIMDNVVIAQEVIHSMMGRKGKKDWMAVKIDMKKEYDRLKGISSKALLKMLRCPIILFA
ncbi:hypothetical protein J1N35_012395 [Gossypium stocksii]|uniref:Reverse transcriptase domain-containing protein n=1 Tax=Gossypium stocksii TaxID=47602 RepID=A0A9D4ACC6_9ROSI|nr:hypothetical protein J1N35_012395 [Gossypium stocksii]